MVLLYRISNTKHIKDLTGEGARIYGGRWNLKGTSALYTSDSTALATLETLVHSPLHLTPIGRSIIVLSLPNQINTTTIAPEELPSRWWVNPNPLKLAELGENWSKKQSTVALVVPSSVIPFGEGRNYILNPQHPDFKYVKIVQMTEFKYDKRLFS